MEAQRITWSSGTFRTFQRDLALGPPTYEEMMAVMHPDDRDNHNRIVALAIETGEDFEIDFRIFWPDGSIRHIQTRGTCRHSGARVDWIGGVVLDLTKLKRVEESLRETEEQFTLATQASSDGIWDWNVATGAVYFSPQWKKMLGYEDDELANEFATWQNLLHPEDRAQTLQGVQDYLEGKTERLHHEARLCHKDGSSRIILSRGLLLRDEAGNPTRMTGTHTDITPIRQSEIERERMVNIIEASSDFIGMAGADGQALYVNPAGLSLLGYTPGDVPHMTIAKFQPDLPQEVLEIATQQGRWSGESLFRHKDGHDIPTSQLITALRNKEGVITNFSTIARDITGDKEVAAERERMQQELIEAQQRAIQELSTPIIPIMEGIIILPLVGSLDSERARNITRSLLGGISRHRAKIVILDITGVSLIDSGIAGHLDKTIQAARLKGAQTIITGISDAVAETIVDLGIDWTRLETVNDLQTGLALAVSKLNRQ